MSSLRICVLTSLNLPILEISPFSMDSGFLKTLSCMQCLYKVINVCLKTCCSCLFLCLKTIDRAKFCVSINIASATCVQSRAGGWREGTCLGLSRNFAVHPTKAQLAVLERHYPSLRVQKSFWWHLSCRLKVSSRRQTSTAPQCTLDLSSYSWDHKRPSHSTSEPNRQLASHYLAINNLTPRRLLAGN